MVNIKVAGLDKLQKKIEGRLDRMENSTKAMEIIAMMGWKDVIDHFRTETSPSGKWHKLAKSTLRAKFPKTGILKDTGALRLSIRSKSFQKEAWIYTECPYAKYHNNPDDVPSYGYLRRFMWLSRQVQNRISKFFMQFLVGK